MKFYYSQSILKTVNFIVLLTATTLTSYAQGPTSIGYSLSSCYHHLTPNNSGQTLNVLNVGEFNFNYTTNEGAKPDYLRIRLYNTDGLFIGYDYEQTGISDGEFNVTNHPQYGMLVAAQKYDPSEERWVTNQNKFVFPEHVGRVEITGYNWTGTDGDYTLDPNNYKLDINLLTVNDAFRPKPTNASCFTFDNFNLSIDNILDGYCGRLTNPRLSINPPIPTGSSWNPDFHLNTPLHTPLSIDLPVNSNGENWCEEQCTNVSASGNNTDPVPCGCVDFNAHLTLVPCNNANANCPEIEIELPLSICCSCDVRDLPNQN